MNFEITWDRPLPFLIAFIPACLNMYLAAYTWRRLPRSIIADVFIYYLICLIFWQLNGALDRLAANGWTALQLDRAFSHGWILMAPLGLHFSILLTQKKRTRLPKSLLLALYIPAFIFMALTGTFFKLSDYILIPVWGWHSPLAGSPYYSALITWFTFLVLSTAFVYFSALSRAARGTADFFKFRLIALGFVVPAAIGIITQAVIPAFGIPPIPITVSLITIFTLAVLIAMRRYHGFSVEDSISARTLLNSTGDTIIALSSADRILYINDKGAEDLGYLPGELEGSHVNKLCLPGQHSLSGNIIEAHLKGDKFQLHDFTFIHKNGKHVPVSLEGDMLGKTDKEGVFIVARDISELKARLMEVNTQTELLEQLFEASPLAMALLDLEGKVLRLNKAFENIFQYAAEELMGMQLSSVLMPDFLKEQNRSSWETRNRPQAIHFDSQRMRKDGSLIDVSVTNYVIIIEKEYKGVYSIYEDITERKKDEALLMEQNAALTKVNQELDKFVYSISHDIRAPLMSMKGIVNIAEQDGGTIEDMNMYLGMIKKNIIRLDDFTFNTIQYYKNARNDISITLVNFAVMVQDIFDELKYHEDAKEMDFMIECQPGLSLYTDRDKLRIVLNNMVSNAIKYRRDNADRSFVKLSMHVNTNHIIITVADNGEGIAENMQGRLFEMFSRFSQRSNGSGLGLYIVKEMIDKLGGSITVQSTPGQGTSFEIRLPVLPA